MGYKKNEIEDVPMGYIQDCDRQGTIETLEYTAPDYTGGSGEECTKKAKVYLPFGYDETKEYPVFYLMHGMGDDETWYFGDTPSQLHDLLNKNKVDHVWQLFDGTGHDESSVEIYLYNYMQMIFK